MKQKERINLWVTEQIHSFYKEHHKMPIRENEFSEVLDLVYKRIEEQISGYHTKKYITGICVAG